MITFKSSVEKSYSLWVAVNADTAIGTVAMQRREATEEDLRAAGYVKASPGCTLEQRIENQSNGLGIAYKELDELKARNAELVKMNEELVARNAWLQNRVEEFEQESVRLIEQVDMLNTMNDGLRSKLKKEYLEEVSDHNYTIDRVRELEKALYNISMIASARRTAQ